MGKGYDSRTQERAITIANAVFGWDKSCSFGFQTPTTYYCSVIFALSLNHILVLWTFHVNDKSITHIQQKCYVHAEFLFNKMS